MAICLELDRLSVGYDGTAVVHEVSLSLARGEIGCLIGPSGCGKTTLLRAIAGFELPLSGEIRLNGDLVSDSRYLQPVEQRRVGLVFQDFALFPHLNVAENIGFGLARAAPDARRQRVVELAAQLEITELLPQYPHQLSGGQQQRVALARALAPRPRVLLMDEPFANLDPDLREALAREVRGLLKRDRITTLMVSHHQIEAFAMADQVGVIGKSRLLQWDTPFAVYHQPVCREVASFVGEGVFLPGTVCGPREVDTELGVIRGRQQLGLPVGTRVEILVRPDDIVHDDASARTATIVDKTFRGAEFLYTLALPSGACVLSLVPSHHDHPLGQPLGICLEIEHLVAFPVPAGS